jgi:hypothetical protein
MTTTDPMMAPLLEHRIAEGPWAMRRVMASMMDIASGAVETISAECGIEGVSSTQVGRATKRRDDDRDARRLRPPGRRRYGVLHARDEKPARLVASLSKASIMATGQACIGGSAARPCPDMPV